MTSADAARLPIETIVPELAARLAAGQDLVLQAEPGAGKTTRVPVVMLDAGLAEAGEIWVAQPRRIAARMAAARVAAMLGERVGERVGYQVRFDTQASARTRLRFVTEGILARRLVDAPELPGVAAVVFDEFHERHLDADLALALVRALQQRARPELRIGVMSATLDVDPVARWLGVAPLRCAGRAFPIAIEYAGTSDKPLAQQVAGALRMLGERELGSGVLVFLPGAKEIREAEEACAPLAARLGLDVHVLHGELPAEAQDRAVRPGPRPKLVLSTNVAETSITIEGIAAVIDSGLSRQASHDPWTGLSSLVLAKISKASAEQRAGRAGRTRAGTCVRLYAQHDFERRPAFDLPELARLDLASAALTIRAAGLQSFGALPWLEAPPEAATRGADELLVRLGALDEHGALTRRGRALLRYPVHPRLARLLDAGRELGVPRLAAGAAALLSERSIRRGGPHRMGRSQIAASSDVAIDLDDLESFAREPGRAGMLGLDAGACRTALQVRKQLQQLVGGSDTADVPDDALDMALLAAFPDRVAAVRTSGKQRKLAFAGGGQAELAEDSVVHDAKLVVALTAEQRREGSSGARVLVRSAAKVEPEWLMELDADRLDERRVAMFDAERERVDAAIETRWDGLLLESRVDPRASDETTAALLEAARARGPAAFAEEPEAITQLVLRSTFVAKHDPAVPRIDEAAVDAALAEACVGKKSFAELRRADLPALLLAQLGGQRDRFEKLAPAHVGLAGGRRLRVHYEVDRGPWIESRLQDFFGTVVGPSVAGGREPLAIHLLAPNQRAVQITTDLAGFWTKHYPELRRALMRRYPKHDWPEDPAHAKPPAPRPPRR